MLQKRMFDSNPADRGERRERTPGLRDPGPAAPEIQDRQTRGTWLGRPKYYPELFNLQVTETELKL